MSRAIRAASSSISRAWCCTRSRRSDEGRDHRDERDHQDASRGAHRQARTHSRAPSIPHLRLLAQGEASGEHESVQSLTFLSVVLLFLLVGVLRRALERRRVNPAPAAVLRGAAARRSGCSSSISRRAARSTSGRADLYPQLAKALDTASRFFGIVGVLRLGDCLVFAFIHWRGRRGAPRILRTLAAWALTFLCAAVLLRHAYRFDLSSLFATSALLSVVLGSRCRSPWATCSPGSPSTPSSPSSRANG